MSPAAVMILVAAGTVLMSTLDAVRRASRVTWVMGDAIRHATTGRANGMVSPTGVRKKSKTNPMKQLATARKRTFARFRFPTTSMAVLINAILHYTSFSAVHVQIRASLPPVDPRCSETVFASES